MRRVMTLNGSRGSYDVHTPADARKYLLPSVKERHEQAVTEIAQLEQRRQELYNQLGRPNKVNIRKYRGYEYQQNRHHPELLCEYLSIGEQICTLQKTIRELREQFVCATDETFESMFVRAAKNMLLPEDFERVCRYTHRLIDDLMEDVHVDEA